MRCAGGGISKGITSLSVCGLDVATRDVDRRCSWNAERRDWCVERLPLPVSGDDDSVGVCCWLPIA